MQILILGSHGVGKSTLARDLAVSLGESTTIIDGVGAILKGNKFTLNEDGDEETQKEMVRKIIAANNSKPRGKHTIHVSSLVRTHIYTIHQRLNGTGISNGFMEWSTKTSHDFLRQTLNLMILYVEPLGGDIEDNGLRSTNRKYQQEIDTIMWNYIKNYSEHVPLHIIEGSREKRVQEALKYVGENEALML